MAASELDLISHNAESPPSIAILWFFSQVPVPVRSVCKLEVKCGPDKVQQSMHACTMVEA